jgi:xylono-1,5-lactonase
MGKARDRGQDNDFQPAATMTSDVEHACSVGAELGEGPVWVTRDAALWFVDIKGQRIHRFDPATGRQRSWTVPQQPAFVVPVRGAGFLVGLKTGLHRFDPATGAFELFARVEPDLPDNRLNDASVRADGSLWFGSMDDLEDRPTGSLYRLEAGELSQPLDSGYVITNGPAFSPDSRTFYHTDTAARVVYAFDCDATGAISGRRIFARIEAAAGSPDGNAVDSEGCVWIALWGGWGVRRYSSDGELLRTVRFPCANVTKIAFGGDDYQTVFATTAWKGLSAAERAEQPLAGDLFRFETDVPGLAPAEARL